MKVKVTLLFKSGKREIKDIEWDDTIGPPRPELVCSLGAVGLVTSEGSLVKWNPHHVDFIEVDGEFNKMVEGEKEDTKDPRIQKGKCPSCRSNMWYEVVETTKDGGEIWGGNCPRCGATVP